MQSYVAIFCHLVNTDIKHCCFSVRQLSIENFLTSLCIRLSFHYILQFLFKWAFANRYAQYGDVSPKVDVYAFGVVLYELISAKEAIVKTNEVITESKGLVALVHLVTILFYLNTSASKPLREFFSFCSLRMFFTRLMLEKGYAKQLIPNLEKTIHQIQSTRSSFVIIFVQKRKFFCSCKLVGYFICRQLSLLRLALMKILS